MFQEHSGGWVRTSVALIAAALIIMGCLSLGYSQEIKPDLLKQLKYRHIGPVGNRVSAVVGVPGNRAVCFAGAASGGSFKSGDGGGTWAQGCDGHGHLPDRRLGQSFALEFFPGQAAVGRFE